MRTEDLSAALGLVSAEIAAAEESVENAEEEEEAIAARKLKSLNG